MTVGCTTRQGCVASPQDAVRPMNPRTTCPLDALVAVALVRVPHFIKLVHAGDISATARPSSAGIPARDKTKLEAAHAGTDVDVVMVQFAVAVVVAFEPCIHPQHHPSVSTALPVAAALSRRRLCATTFQVNLKFIIKKKTQEAIPTCSYARPNLENRNHLMKRKCAQDKIQR